MISVMTKSPVCKHGFATLSNIIGVMFNSFGLLWRSQIATDFFVSPSSLATFNFLQSGHQYLVTIRTMKRILLNSEDQERTTDKASEKRYCLLYKVSSTYSTVVYDV